MGRRLVLLGLVCALLGSGCGAGSPPPGGAESSPPPRSRAVEVPNPGDHKLTIDVGGTSRSYLLHAPPGYTAGKPLPLVIAMHFYGGTGTAMRDLIGMDTKADERTFLVAYPDGISNGFNALVCCGDADDVAFLKALTEHLVTTWHADADRVYLTGISNGGDMSFRAAIEASGMFAAIGVVSGGYGGPRTQAATFVPTSPVSVVTLIGTLDQYFTTFQTGMNTWQERLKCTPVAPAPPAPTPKVSRTSARCADGSDVDVYVISDMGHVWFGAPSGRFAGSDSPIMATDILWEFFAAHPRRT